MTIRDDVELDPEKVKVDLQRLKKEYYDLINNITHPAPCYCRSCIYQLYIKKHKRKGMIFDNESFFLDAAAFEIRRSKMLWTPLYKDMGSGKGFSDLIYKIEFKEYLRVPNSIKDLCNFLKEEFPGINSNPSRIKSKLWRLRKSGIVNKLESEILSEWQKTQPDIPPEKRKEWKQNWDDLKFAQKTANFINLCPGKKITQRALLRHFSNKRKEDLERIQGYLKTNWQIEIKPIKRSIVYYIKKTHSPFCSPQKK